MRSEVGIVGGPERPLEESEFVIWVWSIEVKPSKMKRFPRGTKGMGSPVWKGSEEHRS